MQREVFALTKQENKYEFETRFVGKGKPSLIGKIAYQAMNFRIKVRRREINQIKKY